MRPPQLGKGRPGGMSDRSERGGREDVERERAEADPASDVHQGGGSGRPRGGCRAGTAAHYGLVALFALFAAFPFLWMLTTSFKETRDLLNPGNNPFLYNEPPTLEHVKFLFYETLYGQ